MEISKLTLEELQAGNPTLLESIKGGERSAVLKELEEKIKKGDEAEKVIIASKKSVVLAEAGFTKEVAEKIKNLIEPETVSCEMAEGIIKSHKELLDAMPPTGKPVVEGHGGSKEDDDLKKKKSELPSDEKLAEAIQTA